MRTGSIPPVRLAYVLKKNLADCAAYTNSNYAGIYYYVEKFCVTFPKGVNRESVFNLPTDLFSKLLTEINSYGGAFVNFLFEENDVGVISTVKKTTKMTHLRSFHPVLRCWCEDSSGNEFVYDHLIENEQDMKAENLWPSDLEAFVGIIALKDYSSIGKVNAPITGVINPNINIYIDPYSKTVAMKVEDSASIVCQHGKDSTISSKTAAEKIIQEMAPGKVATESDWEERLTKVQNIVKDYRSGLGLEETTKKIIEILDPLNEPFYSLSGILNGIKLNPIISPFAGMGGGIGAGQIPISRTHNIGDIVENKNSLQPLPDNTWLWCDGAYVYQDDYPDLYQELQFSTAYNYKWGYIFDEQIEPFTSKTKFNVPLIPLNMIKAI
jgi:hypothetical protein